MPDGGAKGRDSRDEARDWRDRATGRRIVQLTNHPSIHHHPFFFVPPWDDAMRRLVFVSHRTGGPQLYARLEEDGRLVQLTDRDDLADHLPPQVHSILVGTDWPAGVPNRRAFDVYDIGPHIGEQSTRHRA